MSVSFMEECSLSVSMTEQLIHSLVITLDKFKFHLIIVFFWVGGHRKENWISRGGGAGKNSDEEGGGS